MDKPDIEVIQSVVATHCTFDLRGMCAVHGTRIDEHAAIIGKPEMMTREEVLKRWPNAPIPPDDV